MIRRNVMGFTEFIREQGVVGFAIGFILGGAVSALTKSFVEDVVNPVLGLAFTRLENISEWTIGVVGIGKFVSAAINFFILAAVVYFIFKGLGLDKLDKKKS